LGGSKPFREIDTNGGYMFKVRLEKLEKGWNVGISVPTLDLANDLLAQVKERENGTTPKFKASIVKLKDGSYRVKSYKSTLYEAQELVHKMFIEFRDEAENSGA
jgi:hypothetical protein